MPLLDMNDSDALARYNDFVRQSPFAQITQDLAWAEVKNNWTPRYVYLEDADKQIIAALSILMIKQANGKMFAYASKGPVMDMQDLDLFDRLMQEAKLALANDDVYVLKVDPEISYSDELNAQLQARGYVTRNRGLKGGMHATIQPRLNMVMDLTVKPDAETAFDFVPSKTKNKLRRPFRDGIVVDFGLEQSDLDDFYMTYEIMSQRHGITYRPKDYFQRMVDAFVGTDMMRIYRARFEEQTIGTGIAFKIGSKIWYMYAGTIDDAPVNGAAYAIQVEMIQWAIDSHMPLYDLGGIEKEDVEDSLWKFKHNFVRGAAQEYIGEIDLVLDEASYEASYAD
ncbi:methicillin resistance protein [Weissella oryzae SG25]|uniref:Methicillin resistance protein n=1 Tax=Weissella oryzae (strain DSM 25784 / JCM 18191 / LMG 30913 / SG25) TaxID=1329250 RepID=A0A069CVA5_WEIOS|nr:peptidoglycan bridge formation glycyltransferase FemA/FemB family protein [Weissella oryzae]GAK31404.1 methicillin resistance protein [Weissella oryzae SG25]